MRLELVLTYSTDVFLKQDANKKFVLPPIHRNFDLSRQERLAEYGRATSPRVVQDSYEAEHVHSKSWFLHGGDFCACEFESDPSKEFQTALQGDFLDDSAECLRVHELTGTFGIWALPKHDPDHPCLINFMVGRANSLMPLMDDAAEDDGIQAASSFPCVWYSLADGAVNPRKRVFVVICRKC